MKLLRFDYGGAVEPNFGVTEAQLAELAPVLSEIRNDIVELDPEQFATGNIPFEKRPLDARFTWLPSEMLGDYRRDPDHSELARIFNVANRLHVDVDAVAVLGIGGSYGGARALMDALCHPYHNELPRGGRGSKPRMYFDGNNLDNDASQTLLERLSLGGYADDAAESKWALCAISKSGETLEPAVAFRAYIQALRKNLGAREDLLRQFVIPVTGQGGNLFELSKVIGCDEIFSVPNGVGGRFGVFSAAGLLPAAMLGIDCIQLLSGAIAMNDHFAEAAPEENVVLKYVAVNHLLEKHRGATIRVLSVWSKSLESMGLWYDQLLAESLGKQGRGATPLTTVNTRDLHSRQQQHQQGRADKVFNNLIVEQYRCDPLVVGHSELNHDGLSDLADKAYPEIMAAAIKGTNDALHDDGRPTTDILLPSVDPHAIGQLMQMLMLATVVEGRLLGVNPYGQPGVEQYKKHMNANLGRV